MKEFLVSQGYRNVPSDEPYKVKKSLRSKHPNKMQFKF